MDSSSTAVTEQKIIALVNVDAPAYQLLASCDFADARLMQFNSGVELGNQWHKNNLPIIAIISQSEVIASDGVFLLETLHNHSFPQVPFFLISAKVNENLNKICIQAGVADIFQSPVKKEHIETRV